LALSLKVLGDAVKANIHMGHNWWFEWYGSLLLDVGNVTLDFAHCFFAFGSFDMFLTVMANWSQKA
jgi:hypothetical protein